MLSRSFNVANSQGRRIWIEDTLARLFEEIGTRQPKLLDVGAGLSPFRNFCEELGFSYASHDFSGYVPSNAAPGLQDVSWDYPVHNYKCDILRIPLEARSDIVLCTEVLEHVPDPVRALQRLSDLVNDQGFLVITVPLISLMHQAPYWFQSGLSPFWFQHWAPISNLSIIENHVSGDYVDFLSQEILRAVPMLGKLFSAQVLSRFLGLILRRTLSKSTIESGGFSVFVIARKARLFPLR